MLKKIGQNQANKNKYLLETKEKNQISKKNYIFSNDKNNKKYRE